MATLLSTPCKPATSYDMGPLPKAESFRAHRVFEKYITGVASYLGKRQTQEDRIILSDFAVSVVDGHGGSHVAESLAHGFCDMANNLHDWMEVELITAMDKEGCGMSGEVAACIRGYEACDSAHKTRDLTTFDYEASMTGAVIASLVFTDKWLHVVNTGDVEVVIAFNDGTGSTVTTRHTPHSEMDRINESGGYVHLGRLNGNLAVSRAFGDFKLKGTENTPGPLIATPSVVSYPIKDVKVIVIASDGFFDVADRASLLRNMHTMPRDDPSILADLASDYCASAMAEGSRDNVTVGIVIPTIRAHEDASSPEVCH